MQLAQLREISHTARSFIGIMSTYIGCKHFGHSYSVYVFLHYMFGPRIETPNFYPVCAETSRGLLAMLQSEGDGTEGVGHRRGGGQGDEEES